MALEFKAWVPSTAVDMQALNADGYNHADGKSGTYADGSAAVLAGGLDPRSVTGNVTESYEYTFGALAANATLSMGGVTLTANASGMSDVQVAAAFADPSASVTNGSFDKTTLVGWSSEAVTTTKVKFTSTTPDSNVDNLTASISTGTLVHTSQVEGATGTLSANNESAFGDAVLYWNDNGTPKAINIDKVGNAAFAIDQLDKAILGMATERAKYGAYMSRLEHSSDNLLNVAQNTDQSRSRIEDADYAVETSELARTQIISQAATAMLAQANQAKQGVLQLLQ
jgi:flagellin